MKMAAILKFNMAAILKLIMGPFIVEGNITNELVGIENMVLTSKIRHITGITRKL